MSSGSSRDVAKAEKQADMIVQSLRSAGEAAVATTLAGITDVLKENRPLMYHIHALLQNPEWKSVLQASALGDDDDKSGDKPHSAAERKPVKDIKLRYNIKKFEHLTRRSISSFLRHMVSAVHLLRDHVWVGVSPIVS